MRRKRAEYSLYDEYLQRVTARVCFDCMQQATNCGTSSDITAREISSRKACENCDETEE